MISIVGGTIKMFYSCRCPFLTKEHFHKHIKTLMVLFNCELLCQNLVNEKIYTLKQTTPKLYPNTF